MSSTREGYPTVGEVVLVTIKNVKKFGAFCVLDTYDNKEGFIHIAEVASGWVKYIKDFVREGQRAVCKVIRVNPSKGHIDLSLKQVNAHQKREAVQNWKNANKSQKLFEILAEKLEKPVEACMAEFGDSLKETYGSLYNAMERVAIDPVALGDDGYKGDWVEHFVEIATANIEAPFVNIRGYMKVTCPVSDGVKHIRSALSRAEEIEKEFDEEEKVRIFIQYAGSPKYLTKVQALDYKVAEEALKKVSSQVSGNIEKQGGTFEFDRESR